MTYRSDRRGETLAKTVAPGGRLLGRHPAREFHHGSELKRSIREAEDTGAVDLSLNSKIKYQDTEKNLRTKDMGQLRPLDRRSPDTVFIPDQVRIRMAIQMDAPLPWNQSAKVVAAGMSEGSIVMSREGKSEIPVESNKA